MGLVAEVYYSLWQKKRVIVSRGETQSFSCLCCWNKKHNSVNSSQEQTNNSLKNQEECRDVHEQMDLELGSSKDLLSLNGYGEEGVMSMHNLCGPQPPRFLFTIKEESEEDLESDDDGKSKGDNSNRRESRTTLRDLFAGVDGTDTSYLTPCSIRTFGSCNDHGLRCSS